MSIKLIPLEKMILDGKEIRLGEKKQAVISVLGEPEHISTSMIASNLLSFWAGITGN